MIELIKIMKALKSTEDVFGELGESINAERFAEDILGFEEVDENEGDEDDDVDGAAAASYAAGGSAADRSKLGVI